MHIIAQSNPMQWPDAVTIIAVIFAFAWIITTAIKSASL